MVSGDDDIVVLLGGTNNVPRDTVAASITEINHLIEDARTLNKDAHILVSEIPIRFDNTDLNEKIDKINVFIRHKCTKSERLHAVRHNSMSRSDFGRDGLHFSAAGKVKFANATQHVIKAITKQDTAPTQNLVINDKINKVNKICMPSATNVSVLTWNINGIADKLGDPDIHALFQNYDVIVLLETMKDKHFVINIPGYNTW